MSLSVLINRYLIILIKFFLIWLIIHFFLYNLVNFWFWFENQMIWLWKEAVIIVFILIVSVLILFNKDLKNLSKYGLIFWLEVIFVSLILFSLWVNMLNWNSLGQFVLAFKYDFLWFIIFFVFYHIWRYLDKKTIISLIMFYGKILKIVLVLALYWYLIISIRPSTLDNVWYDQYIHEAIVWEPSPSVYFTRENYWIARNQFVFERPIFRWFFLVAFWPLFYVLYIRKKNISDSWYRWVIYGLNILITFSRASWWAWIFEVLLLWIMDNRHDFKRFVFKFLVPIVFIVMIITTIGYKHVINREYSNTGHFKLIKEWLMFFSSSPFVGKWAWTAWPASHQLCTDNNSQVCQDIAKINFRNQINLKWFNPENQFIQILVEFGLIWFVMWWLIFGYMSLYWIYVYLNNSYKKLDNIELWMFFGMWVWMVWLAIEGMVLHSLADKMVVYPMMLLYGLIIALNKDRVL